MKNVKELKRTLKHVAQTSCDKCNAPIEYLHNSYLGALSDLPEDAAKSEFEEILALMTKHQCTYKELANVYESLNLNLGICWKCEEKEAEEHYAAFEARQKL